MVFRLCSYEMTALKPPFRAEDMSDLYKKVVKKRRLSQNTNYLLVKTQVMQQEGAKFLLQTIRVPRNMHYLTDRLHKPNYNPIRKTKVDKYQFIQTLAVQKQNLENIEENHSLNIDFLPRLNNRKIDDSHENSVIAKNHKKVHDSQLELYQNNSTKNTQVASIYNFPVNFQQTIQSRSTQIAQKTRQKSTKHGNEESIKKEPQKLEEEQLKRIKQTEKLIQQLKERYQKQRRKQKLRNLDN